MSSVRFLLVTVLRSLYVVKLYDALVEFCQNHIFLTFKMAEHVPNLSMFTNFCINYYAQVPSGKKIANNPAAY